MTDQSLRHFFRSTGELPFHDVGEERAQTRRALEFPAGQDAGDERPAFVVSEAEFLIRIDLRLPRHGPLSVANQYTTALFQAPSGIVNVRITC